MSTLEGQKVVVTGGSRGLGLGVVEALVAEKAIVTVVARDPGRLAEVSRRLGVATIAADVSEEATARSVLGDLRPAAVVLNAGATPPMGPIEEQTWEGFSRVWNIDVKAGLHWTQEALRLPLPKGSRVLFASSGAAVNGSPLSGGYAGAKRMLWFMAQYANGAAAELGLGIRFQALVLKQIVGDTALGREAAEAYARRKGISTEAYLAGFGRPISPRELGDRVVAILTDPAYERALALGVRGDSGIEVLQPMS
jgi:NAD(P)-dependent dehydrogenase (short-subunit alcohol dehydrogenase family)